MAEISCFENLRCILVNARSLCNKIHAFQVEIVEGGNFPDLIFVTETWFDSNFTDALIDCNNEYHIFRKDRPVGRGGGVAIFVRKTISCHEIYYYYYRL